MMLKSDRPRTTKKREKNVYEAIENRGQIIIQDTKILLVHLLGLPDAAAVPVDVLGANGNDNDLIPAS